MKESAMEIKWERTVVDKRINLNLLVGNGTSVFPQERFILGKKWGIKM